MQNQQKKSNNKQIKLKCNHCGTIYYENDNSDIKKKNYCSINCVLNKLSDEKRQN